MTRVSWNTPAVVVVAVVAVHVVLGFTSATPAIHPGGDNAAYVSLANSLATNAAYSEPWHPEEPPHTQYPPLYPAALAVLILLGAKTWVAFKAFSLALTGMAAAFCFLWIQRLHGPRIGALVALLFGVAPGVLISAQWILAEPLFMALVFASLWLLTPDSRRQPGRPVRGKPSSRRSKAELGVGLVLAIAAYFTRSAGLPLVVAVAIGLVATRRWAALGVFGGLFGIAAVPWHLRAGDEYVSAFWMVNPYSPDQGQAGIADLVQRVVDNLWQYSSEILPTTIAGVGGAAGLTLGLALAGLAAWGWVLRVREQAGIPEFFFLLYAGLIVLWPSVWSGDRFLLPIVPLVLLYAGEGLASLTAGRTQWRPRVFALIVGVAFLLPAGSSWLERSGQATQCRLQVRTAGPFGCYSANVRELQAMAVWTSERLPQGSVVFTRKPRLFHAFSGHAAAVYPFTTDERSLLMQADSLGVDHVVLGNWDGSGAMYVSPVVRNNPGRFCLVAQLPVGSGPPVSLLAIRDTPTDDPPGSGDVVDRLALCLHEDWETPPSSAVLGSMTVPILRQE